MPRTLVLLVGAALALLTAACDVSPTQVYYGMATAAEMGDRDGFLDGFTPESRPLMEAQISLSEAYALKREDPIKQLVFKRVDKEIVEEDRAILEVSRGTRKARILLVLTEEGWRIDAKKLAEFWEEDGKRK